IASVFVVTAVTISMITSDAELAQRADQLGTVTVIAIMVWSAIAMLRDSLPDMLDRSLPESLQQAVNRVLARNIHGFEQLGRIRTRPAGSALHVEVALPFDGGRR